MFMINPLAINPLAVIAGVAAHMVIGMLWYSPALFGSLWMRSIKVSSKDMNMHAGHMIGAALVGLTVVLCLAHFIDVLGVTTCRTAIEYALLLWLGFVAAPMFSGVIWQGTPITTYLINIGNWAVSMSVVSCILTKL